jgi:hypothetical protein
LGYAISESAEQHQEGEDGDSGERAAPDQQAAPAGGWSLEEPVSDLRWLADAGCVSDDVIGQHHYQQAGGEQPED